MIRFKLRVFQRIGEKYRSFIVGFIAIIFMISLILFIQTIGQPLGKEEKVILNTIEEKISYDYSAIVKPSTLYPKGGKIKPDGVIFTNLTEKFLVQLNTSIGADKPVRVEGTSGVTYSLVAKDMWVRDFNVIATKPIKTDGISNSLLNKEIEINIQELLNYLAIIEEETQVRPNYTLVIKSQIQGKVYQDDKIIHEINSNQEIPFEISGQYIKFVGETPEKEFVNSKVIENINTINLGYIFLGQWISIKLARYILGIIFAISFILLMIFAMERITLKKEQTSEVYLIDKKYKDKIINTDEKLVIGNVPQINISNFKSLAQVADDKEEPIIRYADDNDRSIYYYVLSTTVTYIYKTNYKVVSEGSELAHDM